MNKAITASITDRIHYDTTDREATPSRRTLRRWNTGLLTAAVLGILTAMSGLVLGILTIGGYIDPGTGPYTTGVMLVGASFIFFGLAAHCLDKSDAVDKAIRQEYCKKHGLEDAER